MFTYTRLNKIEDYFKPYSNRTAQGVYFYRLINYNLEIRSFLIKYLDETKRCGVFIQDKLANPDEKQIAYLEENIGLNFKLDVVFFDGILRKWLPRLDGSQRKSISESMFRILKDMEQNGKNSNILRNAYIKFMCWLYYKFERILNQLGKPSLPKILYEGYISDYELKMLRILSGAGCDILLLEYKGDVDYLKIDPTSQYSYLIPNEKPENFPAGFSIITMQKELQYADSLPKVIIEQPEKLVSTNTWLTGEIFTDSLKEEKDRANDQKFYYNMFVLVQGVEEKTTYLNELIRWKLKVEGTGRKVCIVEKIILPPNTDEVQKVKRSNYQNAEQLILDLSLNIVFPKNKELEKLAKKAFIELLMEDAKQGEAGQMLSKLCNKAVYLICWLYRYLNQLFPDWTLKKMPVFLYYGACNQDKEAFFLRLLSRLPVDVLILCPDTSVTCQLKDSFLFEKKFEGSMKIETFPTQIEDVQFGTVAYHAERELDGLLYQDTGVYRNRQFKKAIPLQIQTTYEEIGILWSQEAKYRPNFEILQDRVMVPVIFAKVSGVQNEDKEHYWKEISKLMTEDTFLIKKLPFIASIENSPMRQHVTSFLKNGKLQIEKIKSHPSYAYSFMREDMQDYIFDKLQQLLDKKIIQGTFSQGTEFTILTTILNLDKGIIRMIQKYDFTKQIPKLIIISTGEELCTISDSILTAFLNLIGFDIVIFTPTGYQSVERNYTQLILAEHQIGEYMYDLQIPNWKYNFKVGQIESLKDKLFRRGK